MIMIASANGAIGMPVAWEILERGGSALDAVEAATRVVEDNPDDHSVGYGGYPNLLGEVELDASIMDGTTLRAGAVGALRGYRAELEKRFLGAQPPNPRFALRACTTQTGLL